MPTKQERSHSLITVAFHSGSAVAVISAIEHADNKATTGKNMYIILFRNRDIILASCYFNIAYLIFDHYEIYFTFGIVYASGFSSYSIVCYDTGIFEIDISRYYYFCKANNKK